ncbi:MAG TPA: hypothetical protein VM118_08750 [Acidobacteriota bacterium]|nr:hypothetical protein [Acidobacteriota bacterium]
MSKSARILCNSAVDAPRLSFSAEPVSAPDSLELFTLTPYQLDLDADRPEGRKKAWQYEIEVRNHSEEKIELTLVSQPFGDGIKVEVPGGDIKPGKEKTIKVKIDPSVAEDIFSKSFTIEASDSAHTRYTLPIEKKMRWGPAPTTSSH